jgi:dipeptidase E
VRKLLLVSNSTQHGSGYLDHVLEEILATLNGARHLLFVPFALKDRAGYAAKFRARMAAAGVDAEELVADATGPRRIETAEAVFVGGGNTFRLAKTLHESGLAAPLRARCLAGLPYLGASAGVNVACPTMRTTNDMPIVEPPTLDALGLIPFQINPHYLDPDPGSTHMGETREQRIVEFLEENDRVVLGLREGGWVRVEGDRGWLGGERPARIFRRGAPPEERQPGAALDDLLA